MNDISVYLGRQRGGGGGGVPDQKNELEALSCSFCPKCFEHSQIKCTVLVQNEECIREMPLMPSLVPSWAWERGYLMLVLNQRVKLACEVTHNKRFDQLDGLSFVTRHVRPT